MSEGILVTGKDLDDLNQLPESADDYAKQTQIRGEVVDLKAKLVDLVKNGKINEAMEELYTARDCIVEVSPLIRSRGEDISVFDELRKQDKINEANMFGRECQKLGYVAEFHYNRDNYKE